MSFGSELNIEDISPFTQWLFSFGGESWHPLLKIFVSTIVYFAIVSVPALYFVEILERKLAADIQMRIGPNRVGVSGIFQGIADRLKLFLKEDVFDSISGQFSKKFGPLLAAASLFLLFATIPFSSKWALTNLSAGVIVVFACMVLYRIFLFWIASSESDEWLYFISLRQLLQISVFVLPLGFSILAIIFQNGSLSMVKIIESQGGWFYQWNIFSSPGSFIAGLTFFGTIFLWMARAPFDLAEIVGENQSVLSSMYSGRRAKLLKSFDALSLYIGCCLFCAFYLGAGNSPFSLEYFGRGATVVEAIIFHLKTAILIMLSIWMKWSLPRARLDQICALSWKVLLPVSVLGVVLNAIWIGLVAR